jgi:hypothetical protein
MSASAHPGRASQIAIEFAQATLKSHYKVRGDGWLPFGITARWLGAWLIRFVNAKGRIQQLVGVR